jgi:uncharacterized protein YraI
MSSKTLIGLSAASMLFATTASAATMASAVTDLNLRAGPGPNYQIVDVIDANGEVTLEGCLEQANWCQVSWNGQQGWAYGEYLTTQLNGNVVAVYPNRTELETATVTYDTESEEAGALALGSIGAAAGALAVGGPAAAVAGAIIGAGAGAAITPEETTITYVRENPVEPVFVNGELITGAVVPQEVQVYQVPDAPYSYVNLNGRYVFVDPGTREITYIADF